MPHQATTAILVKGQTKTAISICPTNLTECHAILAQVTDKLAAIDLIEWRLDYWQVPRDLLTAAQLIQQIKRPLILTIRTVHDGGQFSGTLLQYQNRYQQLINAHVGQLLDLEWQLPSDTRQLLGQQAQQAGYQIILSQHDFIATPPTRQLQTQLATMALEPYVDILKLATMANCVADTTRLLAVTQDFTQQSSMPLISMAMSELGQASRLFGGQFGSCLTFGYLQTPSAPGQLPIELLKNLI